MATQQNDWAAQLEQKKHQARRENAAGSGEDAGDGIEKPYNPFPDKAEDETQGDEGQKENTQQDDTDDTPSDNEQNQEESEQKKETPQAQDGRQRGQAAQLRMSQLLRRKAGKGMNDVMTSLDRLRQEIAGIEFDHFILAVMVAVTKDVLDIVLVPFELSIIATILVWFLKLFLSILLIALCWGKSNFFKTFIRKFAARIVFMFVVEQIPFVNILLPMATILVVWMSHSIKKERKQKTEIYETKTKGFGRRKQPAAART